jgi:hypothetical protein
MSRYMNRILCIGCVFGRVTLVRRIDQRNFMGNVRNPADELHLQVVSRRGTRVDNAAVSLTDGAFLDAVDG